MQTISYTTTKTAEQTILQRNGYTVINPWVIWVNSPHVLHLKDIEDKERVDNRFLQEVWIWNYPHGQTGIYNAQFLFRSKKAAYEFWDRWKSYPYIWLTPPYPKQKLR